MLGIGVLLSVILILQASSLDAQQIAPIRLTGLGGYVGLGLDYKDIERDQVGRRTTITDKEKLFFEEVGAGVRGYVYHPRFLDFEADTEFVFEQGTRDTNDVEQDLDNTLKGYGILLKVLKEHPVSLFLSANKNTTETDASFVQRQRVIYKRNEALLRFQNKLFPTQLGYSETSIKGEGGNRQDTEIDRYYLNMINQGSFGKSNLKLAHEDQEQDFGRIDLSRNVVNFFNSYPVAGKEKAHTLSSFFRWDEQTGTREIRTVSMSEVLFLKHTNKLESEYEYLYDDTKREDLTSSTSYQYRARVRHELYESLRTDASINVNRFEFDDGKEDESVGRLNLNYRKMFPYGVLNLNTLLGLSEEDEDYSQEKSQVRQEEHTFGENPASDEVILLDKEAVIEETITFTDINELPIFNFNEGIDYAVETVRTETRIRLLPSRNGPIDVGDTVYVNYTFEPRPRIKYRTCVQTYGAELRLMNVWRGFYRFTRSNEKLVKGLDPDRLEDTLGRNFGTDVTWRNWSARAERFLLRSPRNPYDRKILSANVTFPLPMDIQANLNGSYGKGKTFEDQDRTYDRLIVLFLDLPIIRRTSWTFQADYRNRDLIDDSIIDVEVATGLTWSFRRLSLSLDYKYLRRRQESVGKERDHRLLLEVVRSFGRGL